jgi:hypothetical protein
VAAVGLAAAILVATGWGAEKAYEKFSKRYFVTASEGKGTFWEVTTPQGSKTFMGSFTTAMTEISDPNAAPTARRQQEEIKSLIAAGKFEYAKSVESPGGQTEYVYKFKLSDGGEVAQNFAYPLEKVSSWEDYLQKVQQQRQQRERAVYDAIAKGNFRLLDIDLIKQHVCREVATGQKLSVMEIHLPDGSTRAMVNSYPLDKSHGGYDYPWEEHLREVKEGKRELLDITVTKSYTYEITQEDGSKTLFQYGGDQPLVEGSKVKMLEESGSVKSSRDE